MKVRSQQSMREQPVKDNYLARVVALYNLGYQPGFQWQGEEVEPSYKFEITYELVTSEMKDGRPFWVSEEVTNTDNEKGKLYQRCMATNVNIKNVEELIGKPVMVTVDHNNKGYAKIKNVAGVPNGIPVPELRNPSKLFDVYAEVPDMETWESLSDFTKGKIMKALDFKTTTLSKMVDGDDDI